MSTKLFASLTLFTILFFVSCSNESRQETELRKKLCNKTWSSVRYYRHGQVVEIKDNFNTMNVIRFEEDNKFVWMFTSDNIPSLYGTYSISGNAINLNSENNISSTIRINEITDSELDADIDLSGVTDDLRIIYEKL